MRNRVRYVNDVDQKSQLCETFQRRAMPLNRKARINMTTGFDARLITRGETGEGFVLSDGERLTIKNARVPILSTDVSRSPSRGFLARPLSSWGSRRASMRTGFDFQRKCRPILCFIVLNETITFQRRYDRENIGPRAANPVSSPRNYLPYFSHGVSTTHRIRLTKLHFPTELDVETSVLDFVPV